MDDFINVLNKFDEIRLIDIYPAREKPIQGVNVEILLEGISNKKAKYIQKNQVKNELKNSDATIFALLGAGDIGEVIKQFKDESVII
jgi:UDP-N-acetylmuramate--alanine ligase